MGIKLTIYSTLFSDQQDQEVIVREQLSVNRLIQEICQEYNFAPANYILRMDDSNVVLNPDRTLEENGVQSGKKLIFEVGNHPSPGKNQYVRAVLRSSTGKQFEIIRQPALIGRPNPSKQLYANMLDADLTDLDPGKTSSRPHGKITQEQGIYYLESMNNDKPAYVNNQMVPVGSKRQLQHGDKLRFGGVILDFIQKE
jgi:pSer/pThr/pTyr-binding forkhead associated (FHA) protein